MTEQIALARKEREYSDNKAAHEREFDTAGKEESFNSIENSVWWRDIAPEFKNSRIIDVGCGTGDILAYFELSGNDCTGVDISRGQLKRALQTRKNLNIDFNILSSNVKNLPFADNTFDIVHVRWVIHHLSKKELPELIAEINRVLKSDGQVLLYETNFLYPIRWIVQTTHLRNINIFRKIALNKGLLDPEEKALTINEYLTSLQKCKFKIISVQYERGFLFFLPNLFVSNKSLQGAISQFDKSISNFIPKIFSINIKTVAKKSSNILDNK